ncbi:MAG TPA: transporter substrate-binding domain-containing protein [Dermatophilaceae bacterium]|nr:transporter substrate-binding domain-containing protein [Dermatophilaceae bacterium]
MKRHASTGSALHASPRRVAHARSGRAVLGSMVAGLALVVTGCSGSGVYSTTPVPKAAPSSTPKAAATTPPPANCVNPLRSFAPAASLPAPGKMPANTYMKEIQDRGRLIAGVSADTLLLGSRNPLNGQIEGFDIDMLKAVSKAIFNDPNKIEYRVITTAQRIPALITGPSTLKSPTADGVDIVARAFTINCARWDQIAFSSEYYRAGQKVLVAKGSQVRSIAELKGKRVCAPNGSTSMDKLRTFTGLVPVGSDTHTGCLVLFQQGKVDAITGDDTILAGLAAQDPYAVVVKAPAFTVEPYGLGVSKEHPEFVRFVNGVLAQMRTDGQWKKAYDVWLKAALGPAPAPPAAVYGR